MKKITQRPKSFEAIRKSKACLCCGRAALWLAFAITACLPVRAGEIIELKDVQGHCVYVSKDDQELRDSVKKGGVVAAQRVIERRRAALVGIDQFIDQASLEQRLDPRLVKAIIQVESAWNTTAKSHKGALGLMQLMPDTALRYGVKNPFDAKENIRGGTRYLRFLLDRFHENLKYSLAAYNAGEKAVDTWGDVPPYEETRGYLKRIDMIYAARQQEAERHAPAIFQILQNGQIVYTNLN